MVTGAGRGLGLEFVRQLLERGDSVVATARQPGHAHELQALAVGNDTGPLHLAAAAGAPAIVLFSRASDPALSAPRGRVAILRAENLADLPVAQVAQAANSLAPSPTAMP